MSHSTICIPLSNGHILTSLNMHNVSVGDIFTDSNNVYRVTQFINNSEFPHNPLIAVETFISGSGFELEDGSFTLLQAKKYNLQHYKVAK